jgi:hypothetical protein
MKRLLIDWPFGPRQGYGHSGVWSFFGLQSMHRSKLAGVFPPVRLATPRLIQ